MAELDIRIWEIGAGLCVRIRTPNGHNHIIDAGCSDDFSPAEHIAKYHWREEDELNYLIISHQDADHVRDLKNLRRFLGDPKVYQRNSSVPDDQKYGLRQRTYQKILHHYDGKYTSPVLWENNPKNPAVNGGVNIQTACLDWADARTINNASIVVAYEYEGVLVIFPGDIEDEGWRALLEKNPNLFSDQKKASRSVILVAPHHGRASGYSQSMIDYFQPDLVVISDGHGAGETDGRFRSCATGLEIKGEAKSFITTKSKGRKRITISDNGSIDIHESDL